MLFEMIFKLFFDFLVFAIELLPLFDIPAFVAGGVAGFFNFVHTLSFFVPINALLQCIAVVVLFDFWNIALWTVNFLIKKIPTI